jgi:hypothetical protein
MGSPMGILRDMMRDTVKVETLQGPERTYGAYTVTPVARRLTVGPWGASRAAGNEGGSGGMVYTRCWPAAVLVSSDGETKRVPIVDVTRCAQAALVAGACLLLFWAWMTKQGRERSDHERRL